MYQSHRKSEAGFSLLEAVIVGVITVILFIFAASFLMSFQKSAAQYDERAKQNEESSLSTQTLISDVERTGANLTLSVKQRFTGEIIVPFQPNGEYQISENRIERVMYRTDYPLVSSVQWNGKGELKWRGYSFSLTVGDSVQSRQIVAQKSEVHIYENGERVGYAEVSTEEKEFSIILSAIVLDGGEQCRVRYMVDGRQIYESASPCSPNPQQISVDIPYQAYISDMSLNAAEIILLDDGTLPVRLPRLPLYEDKAIGLPFVQTVGGFLLVSGDPDRDAMFLSQDVRFGGDETAYFSVNDASGITAGDTLFLCDYLNNHSVLMEVLDADKEKGITAKLIFKPSIGSNGFEKFATPQESYSDFNFVRGTRLIKLSAPIEYRVNDSENGSSLYRRAGNDAWELVIPNVSNFTISQEIQAARVGFEISFDVLSEGIENGGQQIAQPVRLSVQPRALNRTYDAR